MNYKSFLEYHIDLAPVGVEQRGEALSYFCTPKDAQIIGTAEVDSIHYCFIPGFSDMVFAVSPMNEPGNYVHPIANCFTDFLRLILACGSATPLEQAWAWHETQFDTFLAENPPDDVQNATLKNLQDQLDIMPMDQPFSYLKELHKTFDYNLIEEQNYGSELSPWKVWFEGNFGNLAGKGLPGIEMPLQKRFDWNGQNVYVPSAYSCAEGLVLDICIKVSADELHGFLDKWELSPENDGSDFTDEKHMLVEADDPRHIPFSPEVIVNGRKLHHCSTSGCSWNPCIAEEHCPQAKDVMNHYALDPACGWVISRCSFPWGRLRKSPVQTLSLTLYAGIVNFPGTTFRVSSAGEPIPFVHPKTGQQHYLTVQEYERKQISERSSRDDPFELPPHYIVMFYSLSPDLPQSAISLVDRIQGDSSRKKQQDPSDPSSIIDHTIVGGAACIGVIFSGQKDNKLHSAISSFHFSEKFDVEWRVVLHEKMCPDITVALL